MKKPTPAPAVKPGRKTSAAPSPTSFANRPQVATEADDIPAPGAGPDSSEQLVTVHLKRKGTGRRITVKATLGKPVAVPFSAADAYAALGVAKPRHPPALDTQLDVRAMKLKATTLRLEPRLQAGLELLRGVTGVPVNKLVNEAVEKYIEWRSTDLTRDLTQVLKKLAEYKETDPQFKRALALTLESERSLLRKDPAEGVTFEVEADADTDMEAGQEAEAKVDAPAPGSASRLVKDLLARPRH